MTAARRFARDGAKAVLDEIKTLGSEEHFIQTDVSKGAAIEALVAGTLAYAGVWLARSTMRASRARS